METQIRATATLSSRGQITVPKQVRDALFLREGATIEFRVRGGEAILAEARPASDPLAAWFGKFPAPSGSTDAVGLVREMRGWKDGEIEI